MITLNGVPIEPTLFPDNTSQVWHIPNWDEVENSACLYVVWDFTHEGEFMQLAQLKSLLDVKLSWKPVYLTINYLPYGRQDKYISNNTTFGLIPFACLLNTLKFEGVYILDPHSSSAESCINKAVAYYPVSKVTGVVRKHSAGLLFYPDEGAQKKYSSIYAYPSTCGIKVREQQTGEIVSYTLSDPEQVHGNKILIVDDICDGGTTFVKAAELLYEADASEVYLFMTHGIFSRGLTPLLNAGIKRIYTYKGEAIEIDHQVCYKEYKNELS